MIGPLLLALRCSARAATPPPKPPVQNFIAQVSALVAAQRDKPADEVRRLDRDIEKLSARASKLGYEAAPDLAAVAEDPAKPEKLRLWMTASLESLHDPAAFPPFARLAADRSAPDSVREAALRGAAASPVSARARRGVLCSALDAAPGPQALQEALFELQTLGCDDPAELERRSGPGDPGASWAIAALGASRGPAALTSLYRVFRRAPRVSSGQLAVLKIITTRAPELTNSDARRWTRACGRLLRSKDGGAVVVAAETLAALRAKAYGPEVAKIYAGYLQDPRFAGRDAVGWYDRLGAATNALK